MALSRCLESPPLRRFLLVSLPIACCLLAATLAAGADLHVWVDAEGGTHVTDAPETIPQAGRALILGDPRLDGLWEGEAAGEPLVPDVGASSSSVDRQVRALRTAVSDLERGETLRAAAALRQVLV